MSQIGLGNRRQKLQKVLPRSRRKSVGGMGNDIGMHALAKIEPDRATAWIGIGIIVRNNRNPGRVGKSHRDWRRRPVQVGRPAERSRFRRGRERSIQHDALGVSRPEARVRSKQGFKFLQYLVAQSNDLFICGQRHAVFPPS